MPPPADIPALGARPADKPSRLVAPWLFLVFFLSGAAALVYQVVWQRALFAIYGLDITSVTVVVTAFMLGLGIGSLVGGALSRAFPYAVVTLFALSELGIGLYGFFSLDLFAAIAQVTGGAGHLVTGIIAFLLVVFPTALMGATLPLLVAYATSRSGNVGRSVGSLYCVNTLGAAFGAFLTSQLLLGALGLSGTVVASAILNASLGLLVMGLGRPARRVV